MAEDLNRSTEDVTPSHTLSESDIRASLATARLSPEEVRVMRDLAPACQSGNIDRVIEIIEGRNRSPQLLDRYLFPAIRTGQVVVARYLLKNGAHWTSLIPGVAVEAKSKPMFQLCMEYGWKVNDTH